MKNTLIFLLCSFLGHFTWSQVHFQASDIYPQKQSQADLRTFLDTLYAVSIRKDTAQLFKMVYKEVYNSPSYGNDGMVHDLQAFKDYWQMINPERSMIWEILIDNIESGGYFSYPSYSMPNIKIETNGGPIDVAKFRSCRINIKDSLPSTQHQLQTPSLVI